MKNTAKPMPSLVNDTDAEQLVETTDLSQYDLSGFKPMNFEFAEICSDAHAPSSESSRFVRNGATGDAFDSNFV